MITYIIIKRNRKRRVQIQDLQGVCTACTRGAHNAPTALNKTPQRCHNVPTSRCLTRCVNAKPARLILSMFKINATTWRSMRLQRAHLGDVQLFERCGNAVKTPTLA